MQLNPRIDGWTDGPDSFLGPLTREAPVEAQKVANRNICSGGGGFGNILPFLAPLVIAAPFLAPEVFGLGALGAAAEGGIGATAGAGLGAGLGEAAAGVGLGAGAGLGLGEALGGGGGAAGAIGGSAGAGLGEGVSGALGDVGGAAGGSLGSSFSDLASGILGGSPSATSQTAGVLGDVAGAAPSTTAPAAAGTGLGGGIEGASPVAGATPTASLDPFGISGTASGTPGATGGPFTASGEFTAEPVTFADPTPATGGLGGGITAPGSTAPGGVGGDLTSTAGGDFSFADLSGAFGGLGGTPAPTAADFAGTTGGGLFGPASNFIKNNKELLGLGLGAANIGRGLLQPSIDTNALSQAQLDAYRRLQQLSQQLTQNGGQLTPEQAQQFQNDLEAVQSGIRGTYASKGMAGSTAQMEDLAAAQAASTAGKAKAMSANLNTGLQAAGLSGPTANSLLTYQLSQDAALSNMIARLAAAGLA